MKLKWPKILKAAGKSLTDEDVKTWAELIDGQVPDVQMLEIEHAATDLMNSKRRGEIKYALDVGHLINAIVRARNERRGWRDDPGHECACRDGWLYCRASEGRYAGSVVAVPCTCRRGRRWFEKYYGPHEEHEHARLRQSIDPQYTSQKVAVSELEKRILDARSHQERWEWVCLGGNEANCRRLEEFTIAHFPDFIRPQFTPAIRELVERWDQPWPEEWVTPA